MISTPTGSRVGSAAPNAHLEKTKAKKPLEMKIINDPIWGPIEIHPLCVRVIDTPEFQRLRSIKQLGGCSYVYPGACHSRFEHSIGTAYLAGSLGRALQKKINEQIKELAKNLQISEQTEEQAKNQQELQKLEKLKISEGEILCLELGGLCHDLGHGPFSHLFDFMFYLRAKARAKEKTPSENLPEWTHEDSSVEMTEIILNRILESYTGNDFSVKDIPFVLELIQEPTKGKYETQPEEKQFLFEIVANGLNSIDVDKWDYFSRDCHMLGLHHNFQCERTIKLAKVVEHDGKWHVSYPKSEWFNLFDMFYTRFTLHRRAYQHPVVKAVEIMITDALLKADKSLTFPPDDKNGECLSKSVKDMNAYLWVTDEVLHQIRTLPSNDDDIKYAQGTLKRIQKRDLYRLVGENKITWRNQEKRKECIQSLKELKKSAENLQELLKQIEENDVQSHKLKKMEKCIQSLQELKKKAEIFQELLKQIEEDDVQSYNLEKKKKCLQFLKAWIKPEEKYEELLTQIEADDVQSCNPEKKYLQSLKEWIKPAENCEELLTQIEADNVQSCNPEKKEKYLQSLKEWIKSAETFQELLKQIEKDKKKQYLQSLKKWMEASELQEFMEKNKSAKNPGYQTEIVTFNYGNKDESPLDNVKFYEKDKSAKLEKNEISAMLPTEFEQVYIRLYWKGTKIEDQKPETKSEIKTILDKFHSMEEDWADFVSTKRTEV